MMDDFNVTLGVEKPTLLSVRSCEPFSSVWLYRADLFYACIIASVLEGFFLVPITIENLLVIIGIWRTHSLHSPANFLISALAFSDLGVGILALPFHLASKAFLLSENFHGWCISTKIAYGIGVHLAAVSLLTIAAISIERTVALYMALRYDLIATNGKVIVFTAVTWLVSALLSLVQFFDLFSYQLAAAFITFVCFMVSTYCCFKIYMVVRHHRKQIHIQENASDCYMTNSTTQTSQEKTSIAQKKKSSAALLCLYGLFLLCYTPYIGVQLALLLRVDNALVHASEITTVSIVFINSVLNPLLYCWRMRDIRRAMISVLPAFFRRNNSVLNFYSNHTINNRNDRRPTRVSQPANGGEL